MTFPAQGRIAGIDYGDVRIGIAICDADQRIAGPLENYNRQTVEQDTRHFQQLVHSQAIVGFVVGLPLHASGDESAKSREARAFGRWLGQVTGCPVRYFDERFSTQAAERLLNEAGMTSKQRKRRRDMLAAQIILDSFLESRSRGNESAGPLEDCDPL